MTPKNKSQCGIEFSRLMQTILDDKSNPDRPTMGQIAIDIGKCYSFVQQIVAGDKLPRLKDLPIWYRAYGKPVEMLRLIVRSCDPQADAIRLKETPKLNSITVENLNVIIRVGQLSEAIQQAVADGVLDRKENEHIRDHAIEAMNELQHVIQAAETAKK